MSSNRAGAWNFWYVQHDCVYILWEGRVSPRPKRLKIINHKVNKTMHSLYWVRALLCCLHVLSKTSYFPLSLVETRDDRVYWVHLRHVYSWNTLNNLWTQEPRAVIFAPHMCFSVLFDRGKFEMRAAFHSEDIGKSYFFPRWDFHFTMSLPQ